MKSILFYEKPGCAGNTRQKSLLKAAGYEVDAHDLLTHAWTAESLRPYFGTRAVSEWFNRAAPRIKTGAILPETLTESAALAAMLADPLLIRRPLIQFSGQCMAGFDADVEQRLGLVRRVEDLEGCSSDIPCRPNQGESGSP
jgi:ADP-ribosyl-[dinitrogen reductase] hydrolase